NTVEALVGPRPDDHPPFGAVLAKLRGTPLPWVSLPYEMINGPPYPGQTAGFLGARYEPLWLKADPRGGAEFRFRELELPPDASPPRCPGRGGLLGDRARPPAGVAGPAAAPNMTPSQARALALIASAPARRALRLDNEGARLRDHYGRTVFGQGCLLARRLV